MNGESAGPVEVAPEAPRPQLRSERASEPPALEPLEAAPVRTGAEAPPGEVEDALAFALQLGAEQIELALAGEGVTITRQAFDVDLARRGLGLPGLSFTRLHLTRGADGLPNGGEVSAEISAPFVRGTARLAVDAAGNLSGGADATFDVEVLGRPQVSFTYVDRQWSGSLTIQAGDIRLPIPNVVVDEGRATVSFSGQDLRGSLDARFHHATLGRGNVAATISSAGVEGSGGFTVEMPLLKGSHGDFAFADNKLSANLALNASSVEVPVPGMTLSALNGSLALADGQLSGSFGLTAGYAGLGSITLTQASFSNQGLTGASGLIEVTAPPLTGSSGTFALDDEGRPSGQLTIASDRIPIPALRSGQVTVSLRPDGGVDVSGSGRVEFGPVGGGDLSIGYVDGVLSFGADVNFSVPPLQPVTGRLDYRDGQLQGEVSTGVSIGPLSGTVLLRYLAGEFSGEGSLAYALGRFSGNVLVRVDPQGAISGEGSATFRLSDWLTGTIGLIVHPDLNVDAHGELALPSEITLFDAWRFERNFFNFDASFPLWGITVPMVGSIGLIATIHANAGFRAAFGPGTLRNVRATGDVSTRPDAEPAFSISGDLNIPAGAEVVLTVGGGIALAALIARIEGGIDLSGIAGVYGAITLTPTFAYRNGEYVLSGSALLAAVAQLRARINAYARIVAGIGWLSGEVWRKDWNLAEWRFDTGWQLGVRAGMEYVVGQPFNPDLRFEPVEVDPQSIIRGAIPNSGEPVPAPPAPPAPQAQFQATAGQPGAVGAQAGDAPGGSGVPPGAPGAPGSSPPPAGQAPPGGAAAPAPGVPAAPGADGAAPSGQTPPNVGPPAAEGEAAEERTVDETYLVYVYDNLQQHFQRQRSATAPPDPELRRRAQEDARRGEPGLPERPAPRLEPPARPGPEPEAGPAPAPAPEAGPARGGQPLTPSVREGMEHAFDTDLSSVRIHTDERAREGARQIGAEAYTVGSDVYLGPSRHPGPADAELLAHELTHVVQGEEGRGRPVGREGADAEHEAREAGKAVKKGKRPPRVRKRRDGRVHRQQSSTTPSPSAPAAPSAGGAPQAGPQGGAGPRVEFTADELRRIIQTPGDPQLAAALSQLQSREALWAQAKGKVWNTPTKAFVNRAFVRMRFPGPDSLARKSVRGNVQLVVGDYLIRHGEERTDDKERMQSRLSRLMYDQEAPAGVPGWFTRSAQGEAPIPSFDAVYERYQRYQHDEGITPQHNQPEAIPGDTSSTAHNLALTEAGARLLYGSDASPAFVFSGGRWHRVPAAPPGAPGAPGAQPAATTPAGGAPTNVTQATRAVMVADYQAHHVIPLWLASDSGKPDGDQIPNLVPWHRDAHQTNHAYHHSTTQEVRDATGASDYRDFPTGTRFMISALEGGNATHPQPVPAVELDANEEWKARPAGAIWMG